MNRESLPPPPTTKFLTTGQIASYCGVNFRTVIRWIKRGILTAQRLPGRGDHRVSVEDFITFLNKNDLQVPAEFQSQNKPTSVSSIEDSSEGSKEIRILIVDDEPAVTHSIQRVLKMAGYTTEVANSGFEAGYLLERFRPTLITLDLLMHRVDGFDLLETLRKQERHLKTQVLIISGDTDERIARALCSGANRALRKPFNNESLLATVKDLVGEPPRMKPKAEEK
jgi:excisionase family DNA binding protein